MPVSIVTSIEQLGDEDIAILSYENQQNFFNSIEWFACLTQYTREKNIFLKLYIASLGANDSQKCYLFCYTDKKNRKLCSLSNFYTMEFSVIFSSPQCEKQSLLNELFSYIAREKPSNNYINFECLYDTKEETNLLFTALLSANFMPSLYNFKENYFANVKKKSFDEYYEVRPSILKNTIRRKINKIKKLHEMFINIHTNYDDKALNDYATVYKNSWKDNEKYEFFIKNLCKSAARLGILRMGVLYLDKKPVSAQIWLISGKKAIIYKLAYVSKFQHFSVGSILTKEIGKFVVDSDNLDEVDYGLGSEKYKADWMDSKRKLVGIEAFNLNTIGGNIKAAASVCKKYVGR